MKNSYLKVMSLMAIAVLYFGCAWKPIHEDVVMEPAPAPQPVAKAAPAPIPAGSGWATASMAFPTGLPATSNILVEKRFPKRVYKGQPYQYTITVTNLTDLNLQNVNVIEVIPNSFEVISTSPQIYAREGERVAWALGAMEPHGVRVITVDGVAITNDDIPCCTEANFRVPALCLSTDVVDSGLVVSLNAPTEKLACDPIPLEYVVKNTGEADLRDVVVTPNLPTGQVNTDGSGVINLGVLRAGESQVAQTVVQPTAAGDYTFGGTANAYPSALFQGSSAPPRQISAEANTVSTRVTQPSLTLVSTGSEERQYVGRSLDYEFEVTNTGNANADGAMVVASVPPMTSFKSASGSGAFDPASGTVNWNLGSLAPGESRRVNMTLGGDSAGSAVTKAEANAQCVNVATASAARSLVGVSALLLELVDLTDPLEVGDHTIYEVRVTNQGFALATNITLSGGFEDMEFVNAGGHTAISNSGKNLTFGSFNLDGKESVSWTIELKATGIGDQRFSLTMNSDQLGRSVDETESTTVY